MKKIYNVIKENILEIIIIISLTLYSFSIIGKTLENDTFFTIITGNYILKNGVNEIEPFTFHENLVFIKLRWLFDIVVSIIYNNFNYFGIYIFVIFISICISIALFEFLKKLNNNYIISFFITFFTIKYLSANLVCRAQIMSYLFFIFEMYFFERFLENYDRKYTIYLIITSIFLVNFHSSVWLIFFLPFFTVFAEKIAYNLKIQKLPVLKNIIIKDYNISKVLKTFVICLLTGLISPLKLSPYTYIFKVMHGFSKTFIGELLPLDILSISIFKFIIIFILLALLFTKTKVELRDLILTLGFLIMAKLAARNSYISVIFIAYPLEKFIISAIKQYDLERIVKGIENTIYKKNLAKVIFLIFIFLFSRKDIIFNYHSSYIQIALYPVNAVEYMKKNIDIEKARVYCHFNYGSYLEFKGIKAFLDSRSEVFTEEFSNVTILKDWYKADDENPQYIKDIIEKYDITHLVLDIDSSLPIVLNEMKEAKIIYEDEFFFVYQIYK